MLDALRERVESIKKLMPLITDLRNPAMRERHWKSLMEDVGKTFDPHADGFTLEIVLELELEHHSDIIAELSQACNAHLIFPDMLVFRA